MPSRIFFDVECGNGEKSLADEKEEGGGGGGCRMTRS